MKLLVLKFLVLELLELKLLVLKPRAMRRWKALSCRALTPKTLIVWL